MIKLERPPCPDFLTLEKKNELELKYLTDGTSVWARDEIREPLLEETKNKCAYCECFQQRDSRYVEIDHFHHKDKYEHLVMDWSNFIPSCKRCNGKKSAHDVIVDPIINPFNSEPREHLSLNGSRLSGLTALGRRSIGVLNLNDFDRLTTPRFLITEKVNSTLDAVENSIDLYQENTTTLRRNRLVDAFKRLMRECVKSSEYAATAASALHRNPDYNRAKQSMIALQLWDDDFEAMHIESESIHLNPT